MKQLFFFLVLYSASSAVAQSAHIFGVDDLKERTGISIMQYHPTFDLKYGNPSIIAEAVYTNDSTFTIDIPISKSKFVYFNIPSRGFSYPSWVSPGDSLHLQFNKDEQHPLWFSGRHDFHYNAYYHVNLLTERLFEADINSFSSFTLMYNQLDSIMNSLIGMARQEGKTQELFTTILREENQAKYITNLRSLMKNFDEADQSMARQKIREQHLELANEELLTSRAYTIGLTVPFSSGALSGPLSIENYRMEKEYIEKNFNGRTKDFLMGYLTSRHIRSITNDDQNSQAKYNETTNGMAKAIGDSTFRQWALDNMDFVNKLDKPLPDEILNEVLLSHDGSEITVEQMVEKYKGKFVLLDVWASWCVPCIQEFEKNKAMQDQLDELDIQFIYMTIDAPKDYDKMRALASTYDINNHNYLNQDRRSLLSDYLNIGEIPRYILFDAEGNLQALNMPRPSEINAFKSRLDSFRRTVKTYD